jgi:hypothetical protein
MAMPVRSLLRHFRAEFAEVMEAARFSATDLAFSHAGESPPRVDIRDTEGVLP